MSMSESASPGVTPSDDELVTSWGLLVEGLSRTQTRILHAVESTGVPAQWFTVLHVLLTAEGHRLPMGRLAAELSMTGGGFTKLADRIAREGLIDRRNSAGDRRVVYAELTEGGLELARRSESVYREQLRIHVRGVLSETEVTQLSQVGQALSQAHLQAVEQAREVVVRSERPADLPERRGRGRAHGPEPDPT
jgi:DNA-binding MarR family transcriptional regulator